MQDVPLFHNYIVFRTAGRPTASQIHIKLLPMKHIHTKLKSKVCNSPLRRKRCIILWFNMNMRYGRKLSMNFRWCRPLCADTTSTSRENLYQQIQHLPAERTSTSRENVQQQIERLLADRTSKSR